MNCKGVLPMVSIRHVPLGEGKPKICVPVVGRTTADIIAECKALAGLPYDIVELRIDYFEDVADTAKVLTALQELRTVLPQAPLLFTFRTKEEGGERDFAEGEYFALLQRIIPSGYIDAIDVEYFRDHDSIVQTLSLAKAHGVTVVMSNHDFTKTPSKDELIQRLVGMKELGADVPKIACMPQTVYDVLRLLAATSIFKEEYYPDVPIITMSMGKLGVVSRISGETFGSCLTFGSAQKASAPGQLDVTSLQQVLDILH